MQKGFNTQMQLSSILRDSALLGLSRTQKQLGANVASIVPVSADTDDFK